MAGSTTETLNDLLPTIVQEALFVANERSIMRGLVKNYTLAPAQGKTIQVPIYPVQTAATLIEGNDFGNTEVSTDVATFTIGQVGLMTMVTDMAVNASASSVVADLGRLFGEAIARKIDIDLMNQFSNFTTNTVGSTTTTITAALVMQAITKLKNQGVSTDGVVAVLHPSVAYDLKAALTTQGSVVFTQGAYGEVANEAMRQGYVGQLFGVPVYESSNCPGPLNSGSEAGDYKGGIFHRDALGLGIMRDISIETQRRARAVGTDIVASAMYGVGTVYEKYGVYAPFDSSVSW
jgi:N4-gp56 family major capsid protein